jgi:large subunit ribosomal protein L34
VFEKLADSTQERSTDVKTRIRKSSAKAKKRFGFLSRMKTRGGRKILKRRRKKGRKFWSYDK